MSTDPETFSRGAEHFAGQRLDLVTDDGSSWALTAEGRRVGTIRWEAKTDARWHVASREGRWAFEWRGRWPWRFYATDETGAARAWFVGRRFGRGGEIVLPDGTTVELRYRLDARRWRLHADDGSLIATLRHGGAKDSPAAVIDVERAAVGQPALTRVLLPAWAVARLDRDYSVGAGEG